ncbi:TPA: abortive phage resistance protein [Raoultella ornithinolytica]|nr:abortive phage resistance protein [Klebsiella pneumoniae]HBC7113558.1 abortive phage resistance protein [Raoultella ornithinolytica]
MTNSSVVKLQALASDMSNDIQTVLLRAKLIASKLDLHDFTTWLNSEINGYEIWSSIPEYRRGNGQLSALHRHEGWVPFSFGDLTAESIKKVTEYRLGQSISALQQYVNEGEGIQIPMPVRTKEHLLGKGSADIDLFWDVTKGKISQVLITVRHKILDWSIELGKKGILGDDLIFTQEEKNLAPMTVNNTNIFHGVVNNAGAIGAGTCGDVYQHNSIVENDFYSLDKMLKSHGLTDEDISKLKIIVDESPSPVTKGEVEKCFSDWIGSMTIKALKGGLCVAGTSAPDILTNALCKYFKISA